MLGAIFILKWILNHLGFEGETILGVWLWFRELTSEVPHGGAGEGSRTLVSSLGSWGNDRYTTPALTGLLHTMEPTGHILRGMAVHVLFGHVGLLRNPRRGTNTRLLMLTTGLLGSNGNS